MHMGSAESDAVEFVVNVFERTYRRALEPSAIAEIRGSNGRPSDRLVVLISNVVDRSDAVARAERLVEEHHIDAFHIVEDLLGGALEVAGLRRADLEPLLNYSACLLVASTLTGGPWFVYWDPEARLAEPADWITPALELMRNDERVMIANPSWELPDADGRRPGVEREAILTRDGFALGQGFSDQIFLASRAALSAPIYDQRCIARILYPAAHKGHVFEARLDAHMRHHGRLRATSLAASYITDNSEGESSYRPDGTAETLRYVRNAALLRAMRVSPWRPACLRHTWL
jgi:hypothetical protein